MRALESVFAIVGSFVCIAGGLYLLYIRSADSMINGYFAGGIPEQMGHGIGAYCVGRGLFMLARSARERSRT